MCQHPCTPFTIFFLLGLEAWCERDYHCGVFFQHGLCSLYYQDADLLRLPTASRVTLSLTNRYRHRCQENNPSGHASRLAIQIANRMHVPGTPSHLWAFKAARTVLMRESMSPIQEEDDSSFLQDSTAEF